MPTTPKDINIRSFISQNYLNQQVVRSFITFFTEIPRYTYISSTSTPNSPATDTILSISDHDMIVSRILRPKYSLNIQNPVSLTWENIKEHAPVARTINSALVSVVPINGNAIPAAIKDRKSTRMNSSH